MTTQLPSAGWYPDPTGKPGQTYWDGQQWRTDSTSTAPPAGQPAVPPTLTTPQPRRRTALIAALAVTIAVVVAVAGILGYNLWRKSTSTGPTAPPVAQAALEGLLLSPDQINTAMGATGMTVAGTSAATNDASAHVPDKACLPMQGPAEATVYEDSGWSAARGQTLGEPGDKWTHLVYEYVVLFPSAHDADALFSASAQRWPDCSNRQYTFTLAGQPDEVWTVGPVSNTNGTLSDTQTTQAGNGFTCQRALTVTNNVAIDVAACSRNQPDFRSDSAVNIAQQIVAKVPTT